jgi:hypothetical protein
MKTWTLFSRSGILALIFTLCSYLFFLFSNNRKQEIRKDGRDDNVEDEW